MRWLLLPFLATAEVISLVALLPVVFFAPADFAERIVLFAYKLFPDINWYKGGPWNA